MSTTPNSNSEKNQTGTRSSRRKRSLEPEFNITLDTTRAAKKPKAYKMSEQEFSDLKNFFTSMKTDIENQISTSQSSIENKLSDFTAQVNAEVHGLKNSIDELKSQCGTEIGTLKEHMANHKQRLDNSEDDINRLRLSADLRIVGIPFNQTENLIEIFHKIAAEIGYDCSIDTNIPFIKRIPIRNKTTGIMIESHTITLHFVSTQHKQHFYSLYLSKMPLKSESFGMQKGSKITVGENLTHLNAIIFKYAQQQKKENKIAQTFTSDGLVKIKFSKGPKQRVYTIRHTTQLDALINDYDRQKQQQQHAALMDVDQTQVTGVRENLNASIELLSDEHQIPSGANNQQQQPHPMHYHRRYKRPSPQNLNANGTSVVNGSTQQQQQLQSQRQQHLQQQTPNTNSNDLITLTPSNIHTASATNGNNN